MQAKYNTLGRELVAVKSGDPIAVEHGGAFFWGVGADKKYRLCVVKII